MNPTPSMPQAKSSIKEERMPVQRYRPLYRGTQIIWYILLALEIVLGFRFFLKLLGANTAAGFTQFIYYISSPFADPFVNVFRATQLAGATFEWTTLLAMFVYLVVALLIIKLLVMGGPVTTKEAASKLPRQEKL